MDLYIFITEDGDVLKSDKITESDKVAAEAGILDIIHVYCRRELMLPDGWVLRWNNGEWGEIEAAPTDYYSIPEGVI